MKSNMKKIFKTLGVMLAATLSLTNCTEELKNAPVAEQDRSYSIYAEQVETRTINDGLSTKWAKGDSVNVFYTDAGYLNYSENSKFVLADAETGLFETDYLKGNLSAVNDWFVLYPYNEHINTPANTSSGYLPVGAKAADVQIQIYKDNMKHIAGENYPMWGTAFAVPYEEAPHVIMSHLSSLLEINVTNSTEEAIAVNSVTFMAPEDITGTYYIDITGDQPYYTSSGANYVSGVARLAVGGADQIAPGESGKFYLAIKPFTAQANTELILDVNGQTKYIYLDNDVTFSAGKIKTLNFDYTQAVEVEAGPYTSNMIWELGSKAYDHAATINGTPDVPVLKLGTSEVPGTASIYVPEDAVKIGFYAVSWNEKPAVVALKKGSSIKSYFGAPVNENASGNSPYELTVNDKVSYYEMVLPESVSADCVLTTIGDNTRVIIWGLNYYTEDGIGEDQVIADPEKVTVAEFLEAEEDVTLYELTGTIESVSDTKSGNFYLTDDSGSVYIYHLVDEAGTYVFESLELKEGDILTVVGRRSSYNGTPEMENALYVKHEIGEGSDSDAATFDFTSEDRLTEMSIEIPLEPSTGTNISDLDFVYGNITMTTTDGSTPTRVWNASGEYELRIYKNASIILTADEGYAISKVFVDGAAITGITADGYSNGTWSGNRNKVVLSIASDAKTQRIRSIKVVYAEGEGDDPVEEPEDPVEPELPDNAITVTVAEFLAAAEDDTLYELTGQIQNVVETSYGNFDLVDETGSVYIYGLVDENNRYIFTEKELKAGDVITVVGKRGSYYDKPEMIDALYISHTVGEEQEPEPEPEPSEPVVATVAEVLAAEVSTTAWYQITGTITNLVNTTYGNFDLIDETGSIYVYGLTATQVVKNDKSFASLELKEGDLVTIVGTRSEYNGSPQIGGPAYYISHVSGDDSEIGDSDQGYTLSFSDVANRTVFTTETQVWVQNGVVVTNDKAASTNNVADYHGPARFYKNSSLKVEMEDASLISKIVFNCASSDYASALVSSISAATVVDDKAVTMEFDSPVESFVIDALSGGQVRMNSIVVYTN